MEAEFANKIKRLELENFTCFGKVAMDFSPGINVIIGENGTGKTHLLKVLYTLALGGGTFRYPADWSDYQDYLDGTFSEIFKVDSFEDLVKSSSENEGFIVKVDKSIKTTKVGERKPIYVRYPLFIPIQEMLSWQRGFINLYSNKEMDLDKTYFDLAVALDGNLLKGEAQKDAAKLVEELEQFLKIKVLKKDRKFYVAFLEDKEEHDAALVATGINKLAQLIYLIMNGSLTKDTILFWDEPEANLNPKYILVVSKFLQTLAKAGCQIFVATHDYLLPYDLSLSKEYQDVEGQVPDMKFFSLFKGENGTEVEEGDTMPDLNHDSIHEGLSEHNNREDILFRKSLNPQA